MAQVAVVRPVGNYIRTLLKKQAFAIELKAVRRRDVDVAACTPPHIAPYAPLTLCRAPSTARHVPAARVVVWGRCLSVARTH